MRATPRPEAITDMPAPGEPPLARNIGSFFGHIIDAIVSDPNEAKRVEVKKTVSEEQRPDGVVLRRTVIDEVLLPPDAPTPPPAASANNEHKH